MSESTPATEPVSSVPVVEAVRKTRKPRSKPVDPSPHLTEAERIVYERCLKTGDLAKDALENDMDLLSELVETVVEELRQDRIQDKLERENVYLKAQMAKLKAGVRNPADEPKDNYVPEDRTNHSVDS